MNELPDTERLVWRKSTRSGAQGGNCVEVAVSNGYVLVRDSKDPDGSRLTFSSAEWAAFIEGAKDGEFDQ